MLVSPRATSEISPLCLNLSSAFGFWGPTTSHWTTTEFWKNWMKITQPEHLKQRLAYRKCCMRTSCHSYLRPDLQSQGEPREIHGGFKQTYTPTHPNPGEGLREHLIASFHITVCTRGLTYTGISASGWVAVQRGCYCALPSDPPRALIPLISMDPGRLQRSLSRVTYMCICISHTHENPSACPLTRCHEEFQGLLEGKQQES